MKNAYVKIYDIDGNYLGMFTDFVFTSFVSSINGGLGDLKVVIPRKFDEYDQAQIELGNELRIYIADTDAPSGTLVYSGEIDSIDASVSDNEDVSINCSGYVYQLALDIHEDSQTVYFKYTNEELADIVKDVIDKYNITNPQARISYTADSVVDTTKTKTLEVFLDTPLEVLFSVIRLSDSDWYFHIDATNTLYFQEIPTTPTHYFTFGKDIVSLNYNRNTRDTKTGILFSNGLTTLDEDVVFKLYKDDTAVTNYGRRFERIRDERYVEDGADELGARLLSLYSEPVNTVTLRVVDNNLDNGYDIESIKVGDTCKILNTSEIPALTDNMLITTIQYSFDYVDITVIDRNKYIERSLQEMRNAYNMFAFSDNLPTAYTV